MAGFNLKTPSVRNSKVVTQEIQRPSIDDLFSERPSYVRRNSKQKYSLKKRGLRVKLNQSDENKPSIQIEVETPFAVKNRLMNLMGTHKAKLMKRSYNKLLYQKLISHEEKGFQKRKEKRENNEHKRLRELVIDGELEPDEEMLSHPVVRVNQTIRRLDVINNRFFELGTTVASSKLPPITPTEPLLADPSGHIFKSYKSHKMKLLVGPDGIHKFGHESSESISQEEYDEEEEEIETIFTIDDNLIDNMDSEPEITDSNEPSSSEDSNEPPSTEYSKDSVPVQPTMSNGKNTSSIVEHASPPKYIPTNSIASFLDENIYSTESLRNLVHEFNKNITQDEQSLKEFSVLVHSANYKDSFVQQLESVEADQPKIFQLGHQITKLYDRKQKAAEDKIKKVTIGDFYVRGTSV